MARIPREDHALAAIGRIARAGAVFTVASALAVTVATFGALGSDGPTPARVASAAEVRLDKTAVPVRIQIRDVGIDLPVVSSERRVPGNEPRDYPLCDVAQYWTRYDLPGAPGTTWIYAHAQPGMFLPLFTTSEATDGRGLLGKIIELQLKDGRLLRYRIDEVKERSRNRRIARRDNPSDHRLILQTSVGPPGTEPRLQVAAALIGSGRTSETAPKARPRACSAPRASSTSGTKPRNGGQATSAPGGPDTTPDGDDIDGAVLAVGTGAILLGATLIAVILIRRQP
jgi:hypothetical protein